MAPRQETEVVRVAEGAGALMGGAVLRSLVEVVGLQARVRADHPALIFLPDGEVEVGRLTYGELDRRARSFAAHLQREGLQGRAILLMLPSSIYYVVAFIGCLYAGAIPVPGYPPTNSMHAERMAHIVADCNARGAIVATSSALQSIGERLRQYFPEGLDCTFIPIDASGEAEPAIHDAWSEPTLDRDSIAYLQYTSGSTSNPRGVIVTHGNLLSYCESWQQCTGVDGRDVFVTWLPLFHDMGLILGVIQALYVGATIVMMPPLGFLQKPLRWLQAISRYRGTISYAPNFAYELCASSLDQALINTLDLSSWSVAGNAAEPVHADTLAKFARRFEPCGYRPEAMNPSYGLAEATLTVTSHPRLQAARVIDVDLEQLAGGRLARPAVPGNAHQLVSCGRAWLDTEVLTVDPQTHAVCEDGQVGEIWVQGALVAHGYWQRPEQTRDTFGAHTRDGRGPCLRTGDLGVWQDGDLYITGRIKDVIIVRGQNHYPQDIEHTVYRAHPGLEVGHGAAFSVEVGGQERLVIVQEVRRSQRHKIDGEQAVQAIRAAIAEVHGLQVYAVQLLRPASVHITSSGKIQRSACRHSYLAGQFEVMHGWQEDGVPQPSPHAEESAAAGPSYDSVATWITRRIAEMQNVSPAQVANESAFTSLGLDSFKLVALSGELSTWLGRPVEPTLLYSHPSIDRLARHLSGEQVQPEAAAKATSPSEPIAIVGIACRFPTANSLQEFWQLLDQGGDGITEVPRSRWDADEYYQPGAPAPGKAYTRWGGFVDGVDLFDAHFFGISPREASSMDPQQRLLMQTTWHAFEDAGIPPDSLAGSDTGVFVGVMAHDYEMRVVTQNAPIDAYFGTGMHASILANRLSYFFDLHGPSWTAETACSSSFVALHNARTSLIGRECGVAVVAGVNVLLAPEMFVALSQAQMLSPDGRCMTFDARANGYVRSEACAVLVLKRLDDARRDNNRIYGVVAASAINQDGKSNGITAPSGPAQEAVIHSALAAAGLSPQSISYVEAHGTGTSLGDPIEVEALKHTYGVASEEQPVLWIGSVKSNIGHTEPVSGLAGLIKVVLALQHERIPRNIHFEALNPHISLQGSRCQVLTEAQPWPRGARPRVAAVSSFGFGGANTHVIVQEAPEPAPSGTPHAAGEPAPRLELLCVSGKTGAAATQAAAQLAQFLHTHVPDAARLRAIAHTANAHRSHFAHRVAVVGRNAADIARTLQQSRNEESDHLFTGNASLLDAGRTAFLFTGQGAQYAGMGAGLYRGHALFRQVMDECDAILRPLLGASLTSGLYGERDAALDLDQTLYAQPALFAVEYALASVWQSCGVKPDFLIGHSLGEYVAACLAGVFSLRDGLTLVAHRGRLMQTGTPAGAMTAIRASEELADTLLQRLRAHPIRGVSVAAHNTATDFVLSGEPQALELAVQRCVALGANATPLRVTRAFHSPLMQQMLGEFERCAQAVRYQRPRVSVISNVTGAVVDEELTRASYWVEHVLAPVDFLAGMRQLQQRGCKTFIEMGPHPVLSAYGKQSMPEAGWIASMRRTLDDELQLLLAVAEFHARGSHVDWTGWARGRDGEQPLPAPQPLPLYPFQTERHWFKAGEGAANLASRGSKVHPLLGRRSESLRVQPACFDNELQAHAPWFIGEHQVLGTPLLPMAAVIETLLAAARAAQTQPMPEWSIEGLALQAAIAFGGEAMQIRTVVQGEGAGARRVRLSARNRAQGNWTDCAQADVRASCIPVDRIDAGQLALAMIPRPVEGFYDLCRSIGLDYGDGLQGLRKLWVGTAQSLARVEAPRKVADEAHKYRIHPAVLDACFHAAVPFMAQVVAGRPLALVPVQFERFTSHRPMPLKVWVHCRWHGEQAPGRYVADLTVADEHGEPVATVQRMQLALGSQASMLTTAERADAEPGYYRVAWHAVAAAEPVPEPSSPQTWLVACADPAQAAAWAQHLRSHGERAVVVDEGEALQLDDTQARAALRWDVPADWEALLQRLHERGLQPGRLLLAAAESADAVEVVAAAYAHSRRGLHALRHFLAACGQAPGVMIATRGALSPDAGVEAGERLSGTGLAQAVFSGMARAIALEFPQCKCVQVDLPLHVQPHDLDAALRHFHALPGSGVLALRGGQCHEARLAEQPRAELPLHDVHLSAECSYLVTGGLRGVGLETARWLVERGARHLVLVGRSVRPESVADVQALEAAGARMMLVTADVADEAEMAQALQRIRQEMPPLRGVVHSAGLTDDAALAQMDWGRMRAVLAPKVQGAWVLHRLTQGELLDFFLLYSSAASLGGNAGQLNYISACAFLDALAHYRRQRGLPATSINWGYWSETGMAARREMASHMARIGIAGIETQQGLRALQRLLGAQPVQCGPIAIDWTRFKAAMCTGQPYRFLADVGDATATQAQAEAQTVATLTAAHLAMLPAQQAREALLDHLLQRAAHILRLDESRRAELRTGFAARPLNQLGFDSLMAVEMRSRLKADFGADVPLQHFLAGSTAAQVAGLIEEHLALRQLATPPDAMAVSDDVEKLVL